MSGPRVLAVFVDRPWPGLTGDMQRVRAMVRALATDADLRIVVAPRGPGEGAPPPTLDVVEVERTAGHAAALVRFAAGLPARRPPMMAFYRQPAVRATVADAVRAHVPDVVLTHHLGGAAIVDGIVEPDRVVVDLPNDEVQRFGRLAEISSPLGRLRFAAERALTKRWLGAQLERYRAVTVVSDEDAAAYRSLAPAARVVVVPNGTDPPPSVRPDPGGASVLFLGDLAYAPNRDGIEWFVRRVLPGSSVDEVRIVGRGDVDAGTDPRVVVCGFVDDLAAELRRATAMVVPLRAGGGTRLKVLEAFGWGIPVVSTRLGVEGIGAEPGRHYLAAETPEEWVEALARLVADASLRAELAGAARALVDERFTWDLAVRPLRATVLGSTS